eukprot:gene17243-8804_t
MERLVIPELEKAAHALMAPPQAVTSEERHSAEQVFLEFRKTKQPYNLCRFILENCRMDYVLFEAATTLKEAVVREWNLLQKQDIDGLCSFLLNYVTQQKSLQKFVREQILQVVAMIFKRGTLDKSTEGCGDLLKSVSQLLHSGDKDMQMVCCSIMKALLTEYSSTCQSANLGLSLEYHAKCKKAFENGNLLTIFQLCKDILKTYAEASSASLSRVDTALFIRYLSLAEQLLRFLNETAKISLFRPPRSWESTVLDPNFINLFIQLYNRCSGHEELAHHSLQCLIQLASVTGSVFAGQQSKGTYLTRFIQGFKQMVNRTKWTALEAFGYASIVSRIVNVFPVSTIASLSPEVLGTFLEILASLTCTFMELTINKEDIEFDSNQYEDAVDLLLDAWVVLVSNLSSFTDNYFMSYAVQVFNCYLKTHLAKPDGIRKDDSEGNEIGEIDCDVEEDDRLAYSDELSNIGCLARLALPHVLPTLSKLLESRTLSLMRSIKQTNGQNIDALYEDIHWLLLIATNVIMMDCNDKEASIPTDILMFESQQQKRGETDVNLSVNYISNLGRSCSTDKVSYLMILISEVFRLAEYICGVLKSGMGNILSPEIASDTLWFLHCWSSSYLFPDSEEDNVIPELFKSSFGVSSQCGRIMLGFAMDAAETNLTYMPEEPTVAFDSVQLLLKIFSKDSRIKVAMEFPNIWRLADLQAKAASQLQKLPVDVHRHLVEALMKAGSHVQDSALRDKFLATFLGQFQSSYNEIRKNPNFDKICQEESIRQKLISLLETMRGITSATNRKNAEMIFQFLSTYLTDIPYLLEKYANCPDIVELIFELFVDVVRTEIIYLDREKSNALCGLCVQLIANYSKYNLGRISALHSCEDESYQEILLLIRLLTHILSKDYLDFSDDSNGNENSVLLNAIDAVFHGLHIIVPLMNDELLKTAGKEVVGHVDSSLQHFLKIVFELILGSNFDMDLLQPASETLFTLICCHQQEYMKMAQALLEGQHNTENADRLRTSFHELTPSTLKLSIDKENSRVVSSSLAQRLPMFFGRLLPVFPKASA